MDEQTTNDQAAQRVPAGILVESAAAATETASTGAEPPSIPGNSVGTKTEATTSFSQADVERIVKERLATAERRAAEREQKARADAEAKALADQGNFKALYEKAQAEAAEAATKLKALERNQIAMGIATRVGLPAALAERLKGETEEELEADAKAILAALPKPAAPNINAGGGGQAATNSLNQADVNELAAIYGVNPKYFGVGG